MRPEQDKPTASLSALVLIHGPQRSAAYPVIC
jgi:hypothetical protein